MSSDKLDTVVLGYNEMKGVRMCGGGGFSISLSFVVFYPQTDG